MNLKDRIGVSTISFAGVTTHEAINLVADAGFRTIEIFVGIGAYAAIGYPDLIRVTAAVWPRGCDAGARAELRKRLKRFDVVTVHVQLEAVNVASWNSGILEESVRQYLECIEFAHDIGASVVTFHPGTACRYARYAHLHKKVEDERNHAFAMRAIEHNRLYGLRLGFEGIAGAGSHILDLTLQLTADEFGILIDPAQSCVNEMHFEPLLDATRRCAGRIVEIHVHGALARTVGGIAHLPLRNNNIVNWSRVLNALEAMNYTGPFLMEITSSECPQQIIADCLESRDLLLRAAESR